MARTVSIEVFFGDFSRAMALLMAMMAFIRAACCEVRPPPAFTCFSSRKGGGA